MHSRCLLAIAFASHALTAFAEPAPAPAKDQNKTVKPEAAKVAPAKAESAKPMPVAAATAAKLAETKPAPAKATPAPATAAKPAGAKPVPAKPEAAKVTSAKPAPTAAAKPADTKPVAPAKSENKAAKPETVKAAPAKTEPAKVAAVKPAQQPKAAATKPVENKAKAAVNAPVSAKSAKSVVKTAPSSDLVWHVSAGYVWRNLGDLNFDTHARARNYRLPALDTPGAIGSAHGRGGHVYDDGFVSADASSSSTGETWFWGYDRDSQLHGSDLAFHGTTFAESRSDDDHPGWSNDMAGGGPILAFGLDKAVNVPGLRVGAEFSASLIVADQDNHLNSMRAVQQPLSVVDHYTVDPLAIPSAAFQGNFDGPGPIIPASPSRREITGNAPGGKTYFDDVHESLDLTLTTLSLGPTASFERNRFKGAFGFGFALNIASWDADKTDTLYVKSGGHTSVLARWQDNSSGTDVLPGLYLQGSMSVAITPRWSVQAFGRYDWSKELEGSVGRSHFQLDLSGWSVGGAVVYRF